jgi:NAD(P)-dependent dehydrogenase (short-subunit alcohol dehydrogenase family)
MKFAPNIRVNAIAPGPVMKGKDNPKHTLKNNLKILF